MTRQVRVSPGGVYDLGYHLVWCPKYRRPVLAGQCEELIRAKAGGHGWRMVALEIMPDHVHLFVKAHRSGSPSLIASRCTELAERLRRAEYAYLWPRSAWWSRWYVAAMAGAVPPGTVRRFPGTQDGRWRGKGRAR